MVIPFCFFIFQVLNVENTDFKNIMGRINVVAAYSEALLRIFPCLLLVFLVVKATNAYSKVLGWAGLDDWTVPEKEEVEESLEFMERQLDREA